MSDSAGQLEGVTVEIETDNDAVDSNDNGIADGVEIGIASERAETAEENAAEAAATAENAEATAESAIQLGAENASELGAVRQQLEANTVAIGQLASLMGDMVNLQKAAAEAQLDAASTVTNAEPRPDDEAPRNTHWLTKKLWGRGE